MRAFAIGLVVAAACGGPQPAQPPPPEPGAPAAPPAEEQAHDEGDMNNSPELATFHDVLAPHWHAEKSSARIHDTCAAVPELTAKAAAVADSPVPPAVDAPAWTSGGTELVKAVAGLAAACDASDSSGFEPAFQHVHESFHALLAAPRHTK